MLDMDRLVKNLSGTFYYQLRLQNFPMGAGKGWDTVLLCQWLGDELTRPGGRERVDT